jgi:glycosyltransferase involved in cell wall biosynthesis
MSEFDEEKYSDCEKIKKRAIELRRGRSVSRARPQVSVVIPAYKSAEYIADTLNSVFEQTFEDFEVIVVNDGSPDTAELEAALEPFFERIIYARQENGGVSRARNLGICLARAPLIALLDGDDQWLPDFLASQVNYLELNNLDMVYCDAEFFGDAYYSGETFMQSAPSIGAVSPVSLLAAECNVITSGTVLKKEALADTNLFDTMLPHMQDFDLWLRLARAGKKICYQRKVLVRYRVSSKGLSGSNVERAWRNVHALAVAEQKHRLSDAEREAWERQMRLSNAEYEIEKGKFSLAMKDFAEARLHFIEANKFQPKAKLRVLIFLLKFAPNLTFQLFRKFRPSEFSFILPD